VSNLLKEDYFVGIEQITERLDKIIELLEIRNSIFQAKNELTIGQYCSNPYSAPKCTCYKKGQTAAAEYCPIHDKPYMGGNQIWQTT